MQAFPSPPILRVLIADDNWDAADSMRTLVELWGHEARVAYQGTTALKLAQEFRPHVVVLDFDMPGVNGVEVARRLRTDPRFQRSLFIATTARDPQDQPFVGFEELFDAYLLKPYNLERLEQLLAVQAAQVES
jgi:CheY-like chemotaxis protein